MSDQQRAPEDQIISPRAGINARLRYQICKSPHMFFMGQRRDEELVQTLRVGQICGENSTREKESHRVRLRLSALQKGGME